MNDAKETRPLIDQKVPLFTKISQRLFQPDQDQKQLLKSTGVIAAIMALYFFIFLVVWPNFDALIFSSLLVLFGFPTVDFLFRNKTGEDVKTPGAVPCSENKTASKPLRLALFAWRLISLFLAFKLAEFLMLNILNIPPPVPAGWGCWAAFFLLLNRSVYYVLRLPVHTSMPYNHETAEGRASLHSSGGGIEFDNCSSRAASQSVFTSPGNWYLDYNIHNQSRFD